jgi:2-dehydropantoate 2-reductase
LCGDADFYAMGELDVWCVGAGAVGGCVAARLHAAGHHLVVVDADPEQVARLRAPGLVVGDADPVPLDAYLAADAAALDRPCDVLLLAVRSERTKEALAPFVDRAGEVVSLQNGLNEERIAALVGAGRTVGCVVGFGATYLEPGRVELTSDGGLLIGRPDGSTDDRLAEVRDLLDEAFPTTVVADIEAQLWAKMLVNAVTVLGAVGGLLTGEVLAPERRAVVAEVLAEAAAVALAEGVQLPEVFGLDAAVVAGRGEGWREQLDSVLDAVAPHVAEVKSVTLRDFELGRQPEIDAVTGEIVRRGERLGIEVPANATAYRQLGEIEAGERSVDPGNLAELERASVR